MKQLLSSVLVFLLLSLCACSDALSQNSLSTPTTQGVTAPQTAATTAATESIATEPTEATIGYHPDFPEELQRYTSPWAFDVSQKSQDENKLHYYFMSGKGMVMDPSSTQPTKWGDSTLIAFPNGQTMLIDTGVAAYAPVLVENLRRIGIEKLDYLMISHPHGDHASASIAEDGLLAKLEIGQVYYCDIISNSIAKKLIATCQQKNIPTESLRKGDIVEFGDVRMEVLWPEPDATVPKEMETEDFNNASLVVRFDYKEHSSLFTGDIYVKGEAALIASCDPAKLDTDLIKIPHHGYNTSSSRSFVSAVTPELAVATGSPTSRDAVKAIYKGSGSDYCHDSIDQYVHVETDGESMVYDTAWTRIRKPK